MTLLILISAALAGTFLLLAFLQRERDPLEALPRELAPPPSAKAPMSWIRLQQWVAQASLPMAPAAFIKTTAVALIGFGILVGLVSNWGAGLTATALAAWLVRWYLGYRITQRGRYVAEELPRFLRLLVGCVSSGFSLLQALELAMREGPPLLSAEVARVLHEVNVGAPFEMAMDRMAGRLKQDDIDLFVSAVLIHREVGGNLSESMTALAETVGERVRLRKQIRVLTAQARLSGIVLSLLPIFLLLIMMVINRDYVLILFRHPAGWVLVTVALLGQVLGIWLIRRIISRGEEMLT